MTLYIATPHAQAGNLMVTAVVVLAIGLMLLMAGRRRRRTASLRRGRGLAVIMVSVPCLAAGVIYLLGASLLLLH